MEFIKKYKAVIIMIPVLLVLILIRSAGIHFKSDAKKWADASIKQSNRISKDQVGTISGNKLIVNFDKEENIVRESSNELINVSPDSLLTGNIVKTIMNHKGPVLLYSSDQGVSARLWMILSQLGRKNIYILTDSASDNEVLRYKFKPDSI
jgi:hypothetical protein